MSSSNGRGKAKVLAPLAPRRAIVNADEAVIGVIPVPFVEWEEGEPQQVGSRMIVPRTPIRRVAQIYDYVPSRVFDAFMTRLDDIKAIIPTLQEMVEATPTPDAPEAEQMQMALEALKGDTLSRFQSLAYECVLVVWQNSEADMDLERLRAGLEEGPLTQLFTHFFSRLLPQMTSKAEGGGSI